MLINAIEKSGCDEKQSGGKCALYSTNIVFDRSGCIISRYRKYNTKMDPLLDSTKVPEVQIFYTGMSIVQARVECTELNLKRLTFD